MNVRIIIFALVSWLTLASCGTEYQVEGSSSVSRLDGKMLFVKVSNGKELIKVDSAEVIHGLFRMEGKLDSTVMASLYMDDQNIMPLVIEKGKIQIKIDNTCITATGTPLNNKLYEFVARKNALDDRAYEIERMESRMIMDGKPFSEVEQEIAKERANLSDEFDKLVKEFVQNNYENVLGPAIFQMMSNGYTSPKITPLMEQILKEAPESFRSHTMVRSLVDASK